MTSYTTQEITIRSTWAERAEREVTTWTGEVELREGSTDDQLEQIFRAFNRVTPVDSDRMAAQGYELPSLSEGDQVTLDGVTYEVGIVGFRRVDTGAYLG